ncbi:iron-containing alcohol dehydrogenase [Methylogaea oryzae]|uniref:Alcohol dehydrogenase n=1 Tax=Methylogaea oryzae TaxID=1295382 RepID=A0A8D5AH37_9GAMM|nr:iron-containing alcohol dehydrogenase [Methylogaea oryzae]BBL71053.1 alcohol dehydrogenase [Methylogaea oryzae]
MIDIQPFEIARLPRIVFGDGSLARVPALVAQYGRRILLVTGAKSFLQSGHWSELADALRAAGTEWETFTVAGEPSPQLADEAAGRFRSAGIEVVLGIGGGSVLDAAKAIAGLLRVPNSVMDYLEGVGPELPYAGPSVPFIAVPTTAGTGSEATKNAVLSVQGENGFKKSFRHELLVPEYAVLDPQLLASCPPAQIAANGMDALTQLLESYVSTKANPYTDALAMSGMRMVRDSLFAWYEQAAEAQAARGAMLYAALLSGITLAQVGLGSVHGLASPLGAFFPIPHGVACGTMVAVCTEVNIRSLRQRAPDSPALPKYAHVGKVLAQDMSLDDAAACDHLVNTLRRWTERLDLPRLSHYGMAAADVAKVVANSRGSSMKTNPIVLTDDEVAECLQARL